MIYTILAYREDKIDTCRGCEMSHSPSDFLYRCAKTEEDAANFMARFLLKNSTKDRYAYADYEIIVLLDGVDAADSQDAEHIRVFDKLTTDSRLIHFKLKEEWEAKMKKEREDKERAIKEKKEAEEKKRLSELLEKYPQTTPTTEDDDSDEEEADEPVDMVECSICHNYCVLADVHLHDGDYIGDECCWDERLRASE